MNIRIAVFFFPILLFPTHKTITFFASLFQTGLIIMLAVVGLGTPGRAA